MLRHASRVSRNHGSSVAVNQCCLRLLHSDTAPHRDLPEPSTSSHSTIPFRKQIKDEAKVRKSLNIQQKKNEKTRKSLEYHPQWELTVGVEIHAQLNTPRKLFSSTAVSINADPNTHVSLFDLAIPGSQPILQSEVLIPAIRAALALNCDIQRTSKFDRKHYFHWDQPSGYQITQYYHPFAKDGKVELFEHDGIAAEDGQQVNIGIKQVQLEQDTAKTIAQPDGGHLLDFNRVGLALIEIISTPCINSPSTAAAFVRKVQNLLQSVDACVLGMEDGGLRADVNVSVRKRGEQSLLGAEYAGFRGLGQRTEIKNLSSFKSIKDAIIAERDRQIEVLENGGRIDGETRGWTIGSTETRRLRGKEGEVDYRYMPDPDISPLLIGQDLVDHLRESSGVSPDSELQQLVTQYGLTMKDAMSLVSLRDGDRAEYFYVVVTDLIKRCDDATSTDIGRLCGNWILHELGGQISTSSQLSVEETDAASLIPADQMASLLYYLVQKKITGKTAKSLLSTMLDSRQRGCTEDITSLIEKNGLWYQAASIEIYQSLATQVLGVNEKAVNDILVKGQKGKVMYLVGQMMKLNVDGEIEPKLAEKVILELLEKRRAHS